MTEEATPTEPGWHIVSEGKVGYWDGTRWSHIGAANGSSENPMLTAIGHISIWMIGAGVVILFFSLGTPELPLSVPFAAIGGALVGGGMSIGFTWMCIKAIVHEIRKVK